MNEDTNIGPMAVLDHLENLKEICDDSVGMGGLLVVGGNQNTDAAGLGRFFEPTVIANANNGMRAQSEQFFGPIVTFQEVDDDKQALELINSSKYGIGSSLFTRNQ